MGLLCVLPLTPTCPAPGLDFKPGTLIYPTRTEGEEWRIMGLGILAGQPFGKCEHTESDWCVCSGLGVAGAPEGSGPALMGPLREEVAGNNAGSSFMSFDGGEAQYLPWTWSPEERGPVRDVVSPSSWVSP